MYSIKVFEVVLLLALICFESHAQSRQTASKSQDTTEIATDPDTLNTPLSSHGSFDLLDNFKYHKIKKEDIQLLNYTNFEDIIQKDFRQYPISLGEEGKLNQQSFFGATPNTNIYSFNGINLNSSLTGNYNPNYFPVEFMEKAEVLYGSDAAVAGGNPGVYVNFSEIMYNTDEPYTKFWYAQEANNFIGVDGVFSQNFRKNMNFNFGFRTLSADGRFENAEFNSWNVRTNFRWNPTDLSSLSLLYNFLNYGNSLNGGVDPETSIDQFDEINAFVRFTELHQRKFSNNLQLSYSLVAGEDSATSLYGSMKYSNVEYNYNSGEDFYFFPADSISEARGSVNSINAFAKLQQNIFNAIKITAGGNIEYVDIPPVLSVNSSSYVNLNAFSKIGLFFTENLKLTAGARFNNNLGNTYLTGGSKLKYFKNDFSAAFDLSFTQKTRNLFQTDLNNEKHVLSLFELNFDLNPVEFKSTLYMRNVIDPIFSELTGSYSLDSVRSFNGDNMRVIGADFGLSTKFFNLINLSLFFNYKNTVINSERNDLFPDLRAGLNGYYEYELPRSYLRAGFDFEMLGTHQFHGYIPVYEIYYLNENRSNFSNNGLDLYLSLRLGRAFVKATFQNVLAQDFYYVYLYPQTGRNLRISVNWSFFN